MSGFGLVTIPELKPNVLDAVQALIHLMDIIVTVAVKKKKKRNPFSSLPFGLFRG